MVREFKYDVVQLIQGVEQRPCLWDKTIENYKDRVERRQAWEEIFAILDDKYDSMTPEERRITGEQIINKWTNIRDTFVKTLKIKLGKPKKKYLLYNHLKFLLKVTPEDEANVSVEYNISNNHIVDDNIDNEPAYMKLERDEGETSYNTRKRKKVDRSIDYTEERASSSKKSEKSYDAGIDFVEVDSNDARVMNEDEAFFASLLPSIVKYNEDERLEFRIEVLGVMKKIKDRRNWSTD